MHWECGGLARWPAGYRDGSTARRLRDVVIPLCLVWTTSISPHYRRESEKLKQAGDTEMVGAGWLVLCKVERLWQFQLGAGAASGALQQQPSTTYKMINKTVEMGFYQWYTAKGWDTRSRSWNRRLTDRIKRKPPSLWRQWDQSPRAAVQALSWEVSKLWWDKILKELVWAHGWACWELDVGLRLPAWVM